MRAAWPQDVPRVGAKGHLSQEARQVLASTLLDRCSVRQEATAAGTAATGLIRVAIAAPTSAMAAAPHQMTS